MTDLLVLVFSAAYAYLMVRCVLAQCEGTLESLTRAHRYALVCVMAQLAIAAVMAGDRDWGGLAITGVNEVMAAAITIMIGRRLDKMEQEEVQRFLDL